MIYQKVIDTGTVPDQWIEVHATPIFKKVGEVRILQLSTGESNQHPSQDPREACSCRAKLMTHLLQNELLSERQHGFISNHLCSANLLATHDAWTQALEEYVPIDCIYLDFAKAFDTVPHARLALTMT
ncbi:hypothetical protein SNE40_011868 [Patella caerulea]|uniref:Reverse transcriptase domain-containing protein n=1 Tax=Patella caerulea TaxID=87958 RepID=A0AAN8JKC9_PATCE